MGGVTWGVSVGEGKEKTETDPGTLCGWAERMKQQWGLSSTQETEEL